MTLIFFYRQIATHAILLALLSSVAIAGAAIADTRGSDDVRDVNLSALGKEAEPRVEMIPESPLFGEIRSVQSRPDDTLHSMARRFGFGLDELILANPHVEKWLPPAGSQIDLPGKYLIPTEYRGALVKGSSSPRIVVNLPEKRLYLVTEDLVKTYPVGVGRQSWRTPEFTTTVTEKIADPQWVPTRSIIAEAAARGEVLAPLYLPGPENPLGKFALRLGNSHYLIHGTNKPYGVGLRVSHGCLRLYPEHIEELYALVENGIEVSIVNHPIKLAWVGSNLFMEVHPPLQEDRVDATKLLDMAREMVFAAMIDRQVAGQPGASLVHDKLERAILSPDGIPRLIAVRSTDG